MSKYIDAEKLIAEIERRMSENYELGKKAECFSHRAVEDNDILALIDSLQQDQSEVDLAEEITRFFCKNPIPHEHITDWPLLKNTAIHFAEWGAIHLNARKEESK